MARKAPGALVRRLRSDPDHAPERLVLFAVDRMGEQSREFGARAAETSEQVRNRAVAVTRIDGAISGCPFLIALVPAYVAMLWEQARMGLRIAALHGRDTRDPEMAAELLWLRGAHPDLEDARAAIATAKAGSHPREGRRGFWGWVVLGRRLLIMAGFLGPPDPSKPESPTWRRALGLVVGGALYAVTWIFPATFMLVMAFAAENGTKALAARANAYYGGDPPNALPSSRPRVPLVTRVLRALLIGLSIGIPLAGLVVSAHSHPAGVHWYYVLAALLGISLVIGLSATTARR